MSGPSARRRRAGVRRGARLRLGASRPRQPLRRSVRQFRVLADRRVAAFSGL